MLVAGSNYKVLRNAYSKLHKWKITFLIIKCNGVHFLSCLTTWDKSKDTTTSLPASQEAVWSTCVANIVGAIYFVITRDTRDRSFNGSMITQITCTFTGYTQPFEMNLVLYRELGASVNLDTWQRSRRKRFVAPLAERHWPLEGILPLQHSFIPTPT